jgi:alginate O-acetyltransferase complex protein AlgI
VAWGVVHGGGLGVGILWRRAGFRMPKPLGWVLTMVFVMLAWVLFRAPSFEAAIRVYEALLGLGPVGAGFKWRAIAAAAAVAILGPTAWVLAHKVPPSRWIALVVAALFVVALFKIGGDGNYEFIYFQF